VACTLMFEQRGRHRLDVEATVVHSLQLLFSGQLVATLDQTDDTQQDVELNTRIKTTRLGRACVQGGVSSRPEINVRGGGILSHLQLHTVRNAAGPGGTCNCLPS
jgi:hypothetical protein